MIDFYLRDTFSQVQIRVCYGFLQIVKHKCKNVHQQPNCSCDISCAPHISVGPNHYCNFSWFHQHLLAVTSIDWTFIGQNFDDIWRHQHNYMHTICHISTSFFRPPWGGWVTLFGLKWPRTGGWKGMKRSLWRTLVLKFDPVPYLHGAE